MHCLGSHTGNVTTAINFVATLLLFILIGCFSLIYMASGASEVYTGTQFVESLKDRTQTQLMLMNDIVLQNDDFPTDDVILIARHLTIEARNFKTANSSSDAIIDFNHVKHKLRLSANITLTLRHITLVHFREGSISLSPGLDVLLPTKLPNGSDPALLRLEESLIVLPWCYPAIPQAQNIRLFTRPSSLPGTQNVTLRMPQPGCTNDTAARLRQRCWMSAGIYNDFGLIGQDVDRYLFVPNNYTVWLLNTMYGCSAILPEDCIASLGPVGCLYSMLAQSSQAPPSPSAASTPGRIPLVSPVLAGSLAGGAGLLAIVLAAMGLLVWWQRRRRLTADRAVSASGITGGLGPVDDQSMPKAQQDNLSGPGPEFDKSEATDESTNTRMGMPGRDACDIGPRLDAPSLDLHVVVTPLTPPRPDLALGVECGNEVTLLPVVRGKGTFGRVQEGMYGGQRVAVKLLPCDVPMAPEPVADSAAGGLPAAACSPAGGEKQADEVKVEEGSGVRQPRNQAAHALQTFAQEVEVLGRCQHPNVVRLLAACLGPPQPCLVMELMETSLDQLVHAKGAPPLSMSMVLSISIDVVRGLEYLHPTIVHRDLKPANVLVNMSGPEPIAKISDFGLSRMRNTVMPTMHPEVGTPAYMAPECFDTQNLKITHQADIYSFAVIVWEMLTGLRPWCGCTPLAVAYAVTLLGERLPLTTLPPERCPAPLSRLLAQCFDAEPRRRPAAAELVKELKLIAEAVRAHESWDGAAAEPYAAVPAIQQISATALVGESFFTNPSACTMTPSTFGRLLMGSNLSAVAFAVSEESVAARRHGANEVPQPT